MTRIICWSTLLLLLSQASAYSLQGKRALVTGSSGGISKGIALELARHGANVLVHYNERAAGAAETAATIEREGGVCAGTVQADFRNTSSIRHLIAAMDQIWPEGMDILVNNAGIVTKLALEDDDEDLTAWHECLAVNLHAPRMLSQLCMSRMKQRGGGVILQVSSIHSEKSNEFVAPYAVSKSALDSLTRTMAIEWAAYNIRVNAIAPGVVPVERTAEAFAVEANVRAWADRIPLNRLGTVQEVAEACVPLLTNDWITGTVWQVDGGMMARSNMPDRERPLQVGGYC